VVANPAVESGAVSVEAALAPGLAAELAPVLRSLPYAATYSQGPSGIVWRCEFNLPTARDPQYPDCLFSLREFLNVDACALAKAHLGGNYENTSTGTLAAWMIRKGCYVDAERSANPGHVDFVLDISGAAWPAEWGGHLEFAGADGIEQLPASSAGTLHLLAGGAPRIPLLTRQVEGLWVVGRLTRA